MLKLIHGEFYRLIRSGSFKISLLLSVACGALIALAYLAMGGMTKQEIFVVTFQDIQLPFIFAGIFCASFIGGEFSKGTIRRVVTAGYTRGEILFSKWVVALLGSLLIRVIYPLISYFIYVLSGKADKASNSDNVADWVFGNFFRYFMKDGFLSIAIITLFIMFAFVCKKQSLTTTFNMLFLIGTMLVALMVFNLKSLEFLRPIMKFFPTYFITNLNHSVKTVSDSVVPPTLVNVGLTALVFVAIGYCVSYFMFRKAEMK
ncbi:hypothetical protein FACS1894132_06830 [Clostridia bacterium]|nr:hypothetical protein FACS1894132_06830 [Clostridia bacterium]